MLLSKSDDQLADFRRSLLSVLRAIAATPQTSSQTTVPSSAECTAAQGRE